MKEAIKVLDYGYVRLVDYMGSDMGIVRAARNSYDAEPRGGSEDERLINYLMENRHTSPFEMAEFIFDVKLPIFVARQWVRHRTASINEVSARYTELPNEFYVPEPEHIGIQSTSSKQARDFKDFDLHEAQASCAAIASVSKWSHGEYRHLLTRGVPRELARSILPVNTYTRWFWKIDMHNLFHFLRLRLHKHAQYEIRVYAETILGIIRPLFPQCVAAFERWKPVMLNTDERLQLMNALTFVREHMGTAAPPDITKLLEKLAA